MRKSETVQATIAQMFGRSQSWVSKQQTAASDPMPRDLAGATDWGRRHGCLPLDSEPLLAAPAAATGGVAHEDAMLKSARRQMIELELAKRSGRLVSIEEVEERELAMAVEFRHAAIEFPSRVRAILDRLVDDPARVVRIYDEMKPLAAELLNRADPQHLMKTMSKDDVRAMLLRRVDELLEGLG